MEQLVSSGPGPQGPGKIKKEKESYKLQAPSFKLQAPAGLSLNTIKMYKQLRKKKL